MPSLAATLAPLEAPPREIYERPRALPVSAPGATITRQFSLWPFGTRVLKLFLLCDPTPWDPALGQALLRAMQQEYFRSEARSQTNALRSAILAAHFSLKERNSDKLAQERATAAAACAVSRGATAYVALAGEAAALSWSNGSLTMQRAPVRVARPLGAEAQPRVAFWSTSLGPGDRLALVCGAAWKDDSADAVANLLSTPRDAIREHLALLLAGSDGPARVWLAEGPATPPAGGKVFTTGSAEATSVRPMHSAADHDASDADRHLGHSRPRRARRDWIVAVGILGAVGLAVIGAGHVLDRPAQVPSAEAAAAARDWRVANLGQAAGNLVDLAVGDGAAYALDAQAQVVRRIPLAGRTTDAGAVVVRRGTAVGGESLDAPTAVAWVSGLQGDGKLLVLDRARAAALVSPSGDIRAVDLPRSSEWRSIDAVQGGRDALYVLDRQSARILAYDQLSSNAGPRVRDLASDATTPGLHLEDVADLAVASDVYLRYRDGSVRRVDSQGRQQPFDVKLPNGRLGPVAGVATDEQGGLYLLDAENDRVVEVQRDGTFVRDIAMNKPGEIGTARLVQSAGGDQRLVYVDQEGVEAIDLPAPSSPRAGG